MRDDSSEPAFFPASVDPEGTDRRDEPSWGNCRKCRRLGHLYPESVIGRVDELCRECCDAVEIP